MPFLHVQMVNMLRVGCIFLLDRLDMLLFEEQALSPERLLGVSVYGTRPGEYDNKRKIERTFMVISSIGDLGLRCPPKHIVWQCLSCRECVTKTSAHMLIS